MPYNTRRKSLSLPSLGIHIPVTNAARAAAAAKASGRPSPASSSRSSTTPPRASATRSQSPDDAHPNKRIKRSHESLSDAVAIEATPPPSPTPASSVDDLPKVDLEGINDDIVEATITQLQDTANRPHLVKDLATILALSLTSVQKYGLPPSIREPPLRDSALTFPSSSANPCAIISSRLASYMKRSCWSALAPCPLAKELETVHPRRTYYFLTTYPRQPLPESGSLEPLSRMPAITPSVSLTDDTGSDDVDARRRQLSPSPEIDLPPPDFDDAHDSGLMPLTPVGSVPKFRIRDLGDLAHDLPALEKDEREFTQTADILQKRKFTDKPSLLDMEYGHRDDMWFSDYNVTALMTSPAVKPSIHSTVRKEDESESWVKLHKLSEWDQDAESIEIDELDGLMEGC